jgi:hypothetical protein
MLAVHTARPFAEAKEKKVDEVLQSTALRIGSGKAVGWAWLSG